MQKLKNMRIASLVIWLIIAVASMMTMPDFTQLVREKGQVTLPKDTGSQIAQEMLKKMNENGGDSYQIIAVYSNKDGKSLTNEQQKEIHSALSELKANAKQFGITDIVSHLDNKETENQLVSKDNTTILTQISVDKKHGKHYQRSAE